MLLLNTKAYLQNSFKAFVKTSANGGCFLFWKNDTKCRRENFIDLDTGLL